MDQYVGLDVSLKETFVCVVDACGEVVCEKSVGTTPETIAKFIEKRAPSAVRIGLESGLLTGRLAPDHKTIADFRKDNGRLLVGWTFACVFFACKHLHDRG